MPTPPKAWVQMGYLKIDEYFEKTQEELGAYLKMPLPTEDLATEAPVYNTEGDLRVLVLDLPSNTKKFTVPLCKFVNENWTKEHVDNWQHGTLYCPVKKIHDTPHFLKTALPIVNCLDTPFAEDLWSKAHIVVTTRVAYKCELPL